MKPSANLSNIRNSVPQPLCLFVTERKTAEIQRLCRALTVPFSLIMACGGKEGYRKATELQPQIILCDNLLSERQGLQFCQSVKQNPITGDIPVILLSPADNRQELIAALQAGADACASPRDTDLLICLCDNLLLNRQRIRTKYLSDYILEHGIIPGNSSGHKLFSKAIRIIGKHIDDADFDSRQFAQEMGLSRTNLFARIKSLTGLTPHELVLKIRLRQARIKLISHPEMNMSEIAYETGFSSPGYLIKCFKKAYGKPPKAYRKEALSR